MGSEFGPTSRRQRTSALLVFVGAFCILFAAILTGSLLEYLGAAVLGAGGTASLLTARRLDRR